MAWEHPLYLGGVLKSLMLLWKEVALEEGYQCRISTDRDYKTVLDRVQCEGQSFLTITLPQFGQDLQKCLEQEYVDSASFLGFKKRLGLPAFLRGFLSRIFSNDGVLLPNPCVDSIRAVRQLTLMFGKIELPCSPKREDMAYNRYLECEQDVRTADKEQSEDGSVRYKRISRLLFADLFSRVDFAVYSGTAVPRHGPGATADGLKANQKYLQKEWTQRLEQLFPAVEYLFPSFSSWRSAQRVDFLEPGRERPVKVITVPKTLRTPRLIAMEPTCMTYVQQALLELLVQGVENDPVLYEFLGFDDQFKNQEMARRGSLNGNLATLDLSDASDRVSNQHVRALLEKHPWLFQAVDASRSRKADVRGKVIRLAKFASMGSSLCFPFEAMVFLTVVFMGIEEGLGRRLTNKLIKSYIGSVRVYGDDIIIPIDMVQPVVRNLETFGFKVNRHKSFWNGKFRESCGKEYYGGLDVSIVKVRQMLPKRRADVREIVSSVALRNNFYCNGLWRSARHIEQVLGKFYNFPFIWPTSPSLGYYTFLPPQGDKMCRRLHRPLVKGFAVVPLVPKSPLGDEGALLKFFLKRGVEPHQRNHLVRSGRPTTVGIRRGWFQPY